MELKIKKFEELTTKELFKIYEQRCAIFIVEQNCPYQDVDYIDFEADHNMLFDNEELAAYTRVYFKGENISFGRVLVNANYRQGGYGKEIVKTTLGFIAKTYPKKNIAIQAQAYLQDFYRTFGFDNIGEEYLEDDIPHIDMICLKEQ